MAAAGMLARIGPGIGTRGLWLSLAALALGASAHPASTTAATIDVGYHGDENNGNSHGCALREAIRSANEDASIGNCDAGDLGMDRIRVEAGNHDLTVPGLEEFSDAGDLDITDDVKVIGRGNGFTLDGGGADGIEDRLFDIRGTAKATIDNAVLRGGYVIDGADGGAIRVADDATLKVFDSVLRRNEGADAAGFGGAIDSGGTLTLKHVKVIRNQSVYTGAMLLDGSATLKRVTVANNRAAYFGGAILSEAEDLKIIDSTINGNSLWSDAGGVHTGGGLWVTIGNALLRNVTVSGNEAAEAGGGISIGNGTLLLVNTTVTDNTADLYGDSAEIANGGGIYRSGGTLELRSSVVANNHDDTVAGAIHPDCSGAVASRGYNLIRNQTGCTIGGAPSDPDVAAGTNPKLQPLADNGGPTRTHALAASSPLIDLIPGADCTDGALLLPQLVRTDQRGVRRPQSGQCDVGAYERR